MQIHYDRTRERRFKNLPPIGEGTPAWLTICLTRSLIDWFGRPRRAFYRSGSTQLQFGYEIISVPVAEFAQTFGLLLRSLDQVWPVQIFGMADNGELVQLSFSGSEGMLAVRQHGISGIWHESLHDICASIRLPVPQQAEYMFQLLRAVELGEPVIALDWSCAEFLEQQRLSRIDRTLSFCYVSLDDPGAADASAACLAGLTPEQKTVLWRLFLEKRLIPLEFEWLRDALLKDCVPRRIEWHLALYRALEELEIRMLGTGNQFELTDKTGKRLYFGADHTNAAEQVLMKLLFPLNQ